MFANKGLPMIDANDGGSVLRMHESLMKAYNCSKNVDTIINGHTPANTTWADPKEFAEFNHDFRTWAQGALKSRKAPEAQAAEWKVPEKDEGYSQRVSTMLGGLADA
jgi:hypothetical protein